MEYFISSPILGKCWPQGSLPEYVEHLKDEAQVCAIIERVQRYLEEKGHEEIRDELRGWCHMPNAPDAPVHS